MQTAIDWLVDKINGKSFNKVTIDIPAEIIEKAIEIQKAQIILAWENGALPDFLKENKCSRDYFEQTYKKHGDETI